jgi:hypothetical protein
MGQKTIKNTLLRVQQLKSLNSQTYLFNKNLQLNNLILNLFYKSNFYIDTLTIDFSANKISLFLTIFLSTKKIIFFKKKKTKLFYTFDKELTKIFKNLKLNNFNNIIYKIKILNYLNNKESLIYLYNNFKQYSKVLFEKRLILFVDFIKTISLLNENKISLKFFGVFLGLIFKRLHKYKHKKFFVFLKKIFLFLKNNKFSKSVGGLKFELSGKLRGKTMSSKITFSSGKISTQTFKNSPSYIQEHVFTKYGVFGLKLWLINNII